jgi:two-component system CheB/CheR fusion protein
LRQPLQTLSLLKGILAKAVTGDYALGLVEKLDEPLQVMSSTLNTLLDINQLEAGIVRPEIVVFSIEALFDRLQTEFGYHAATKNLDWRVIACGLHVRSDPRLVEQMIRNLLWNAVKYTEQGKILLGCRRRGDSLRIEVWDTGLGIPVEHLEAIFEEFHQVDNPARERSLGLGLGLAIVQRIGHMLGHAIDVRSRIGKGSVFAIEVPLACAQAGVWEPKDPPAAGAFRTLSSTIMIVEDDPMVREMLELLFQAEGHRILTAGDGHKALELVAQGAEPDIVIADYNLPGGMSGLEAIIEMRRVLHRQVPVIILTGDISTATLAKIAERRCVHLNKPTDSGHLTRLVGTLLSGQRRQGAKDSEPLPRPQVAKPPAVNPGIETAPQSVFVIDDDASLRTTMSDLLTLNGRTVETFSSCEAFLENYTPPAKGCLVVDVQMQGMGGFELLERLNREGIDLPAVMITGYGDVSMAVRAMKAGAKDFIEKPVDPDELLASIDNALNQSDASFALSERTLAAAQRIADLTPREHMVMDLVLAGHPSKNIAADLGISQRTVENHRASIMKKTGSKSIPALIRLVLAAA